MAQAHEDMAAELHAEIAQQVPVTAHSKDMAGGDLGHVYHDQLDEKLDPTADGDEPTEVEKRTLRRVGDPLPLSAFLVAMVELAERFTYYGAQGLFQNYVSNHANGEDGAPGLGLGHQGATGLNVFFQFWCYVTPIPAAIVADQYLGKYNTIVLSACIYLVGLVILWTTALPVAIENGASLGGYVTAIIVIGIGTGGIKTNVSPLIADQHRRKVMAISTVAKTGERVIIDPAITYQRIYMIFYACINLGSLSLLATPFMERYCGFWSAYLLCFCMFVIGFVVLVLGRKKYVVRPPQGSVITDAFKAIGLMIKYRSLDAPKPSWRAGRGLSKPVGWNDHFVEELKRALRACKVFTFYPIFWLCYVQFSGNFVSQAAQMEGHGMPNDLMQNFDPIAILVALPILDRLVYPALRRVGIPLRPMLRITIGFFLAGLGIAYAAIVQHLIYAAGPCYEDPLHCPAAAGQGPGGVNLPNHVHIAVQTPAYVFIGLAEIFLNVTGLEYAYTKSPPSMKSFVQSLYLLTTALGFALSEAFLSVVGDPKILWMYTGIACAAAVVGILFWVLFHHYDDMEEEMNKLDRYDPYIGEGAPPGSSQSSSGPGGAVHEGDKDKV